MQNASASLYRHLWPVSLCRVFPHYLINGTTFEKKCFWTQNVFWFCLQSLSEIFIIIRRIQRDTINEQYIGLHVKYPSFLWHFNETLIFSTNFQKILTEISCAEGRTNRHDESNSLFSQFCERARKSRQRSTQDIEDGCLLHFEFRVFVDALSNSEYTCKVTERSESRDLKRSYSRYVSKQYSDIYLSQMILQFDNRQRLTRLKWLITSLQVN